MISKDLLKKYDIPAPRYTSYPTVPYWSDSPTAEEWIESLRRVSVKPETSWSMYVHIPFCESLCTFCGCNTTITRNHQKESPYVDMVLHELELYHLKAPDLFRRPLRQIHLGGGTPTFLSASELTRLIVGIDKLTFRDPTYFEGSVEVDPRRTNEAQLKALFDVGFRRVSLGVQDFDPEVQRLVNRIQPFEVTARLTEAARAIGQDSVNFDLIYGLPKQTLETMKDTIEKTIELRPDRIALYSFAKVPWIKPAQRLFKDEDLPEGAEKRALYELSYEMLEGAGYVEIGMDHFALPTDSLAISQIEHRLHRNFMGYTDVRTDVLLGIGVSSISETPDCFHQNEKVLPVYERTITEGRIATFRGHKLSPIDQERREQILTFMTSGEVALKDSAQESDTRDFLKPLLEDRLIEIQNGKLRITEEGKPFLRNACMALDQRLREQKPNTRIFSQSL
jgi:oxygen-independent coproporphyrinogen III oxidase